jgi:molybdate transport system regulatory protein
MLPRASATTAVSLKLRFPGDRALGPGKVRLLELIAESGSIAAACRAMDMSYPRALKLINELNAAFAHPLVITQIGGASRGGASITPLGRDIARRYRSIEARIYSVSRKQLAALHGALAG